MNKINEVTSTNDADDNSTLYARNDRSQTPNDTSISKKIFVVNNKNMHNTGNNSSDAEIIKTEAIKMFDDNPDIAVNDKAKAVEVAAEITNLAANNVKKATNRDVNVPSLLNFSSGFVNDKDVSIDYNLMYSFAGCTWQDCGFQKRN